MVAPLSPFTNLAAAKDAAVDNLVAPGDWLAGPQRRAVWLATRGELLDAGDEAPTGASATVVDRVANEPGELSIEWAREQMAALGDAREGAGRYVELVGVTAMAIVIDRFDIAVGAVPVELPPPHDGEPARHWPDGVGDVGAWVPQMIEKRRANVSRALTAAPVTAGQWIALVDAFYSRGAEFNEIVWDRALSRPQVELVAARTTSLHSCFY